MKLTLAHVSSLCNGGDVRTVKRLDAASKEIDDIDDISACVELTRVDLSSNALEKLGGLEHCAGISWLNVAHNQLTSLIDLRKLTALTVLNVSHNSLTSINYLANMHDLKALVLNNNNIATLENLATLKQLNTLVISHNKIEVLEGFTKLENLKKLSASHNKIRSIPDLSGCSSLQELRLNNNMISALPKSLELNARLRTVDLGANRIKKVTDLLPLKGLPNLISLNVAGNGLCQEEDYENKIAQLLPKLEVLNGKKVGGATNRKRPASKLVETTDATAEDGVHRKKRKSDALASANVSQTETKNSHATKPRKGFVSDGVDAKKGKQVLPAHSEEKHTMPSALDAHAKKTKKSSTAPSPFDAAAIKLANKLGKQSGATVVHDSGEGDRDDGPDIDEISVPSVNSSLAAKAKVVAVKESKTQPAARKFNVGELVQLDEEFGGTGSLAWA